jgi:hypothetical protein
VHVYNKLVSKDELVSKNELVSKDAARAHAPDEYVFSGGLF